MNRYEIYYKDENKDDIVLVELYAETLEEVLEKFKQDYAPLDKIDTIFCRWGITMKQVDMYSVSEIVEMIYPDATGRIPLAHLSSYVYESLFQPEYDNIRMLNYKVLSEQIEYFERERNRLREFDAIVAKLNNYIWILEQVEYLMQDKKLPEEFIINPNG